MTYDGKTPDQMTAEELETAFREAERGKVVASNHYGLMLAAQRELVDEIVRRDQPIN